MSTEVSTPHLLTPDLLTPRLWVLLIALLFLSASLTRDFHSRGEPREAIVMQDMLASGDFILPEGYGGVVPSKPPLLHWLGVFFSLPAGQVSEFSARLPSVLAACMAALFCFYLFAPQSSSLIAVTTMLILSTSIEWLRAASSARVDMVLAASLTAAFYFLFRWSQNSYRGFPLAFVVSVALAMLCKGPVGAVLPGLVFVLWSLHDRVSLITFVQRSFVVFVPATLIAAAWYIAAYLQEPEAFLNMVYYENVERFLSMQADEPHKASALKLYATVLLGFLPWTLIAFMLIPAFIGSTTWSREKFSRSQLNKFWQKLSTIDRYSLIVVFVTVIFFSIPEGKRSVYLLPIYPFLSFWLARLFISEATSAQSQVFLTATRVLSGFVVALLVVIGVFIFLPLDAVTLIPESPRLLATEVQSSFRSFLGSSILMSLISCVSLIAMLLMGWRTFSKARSHNAMPWFLILLFAVYSVSHLLIVPAVVNPISPKQFGQRIEREISPGVRLLSFGEEFYGLSFYSKRRIDRSENTGFALGSAVIVSDRDVPELEKQLSSTQQLKLLLQSGASVMKYGERLMVYEVSSR